MSDYPISTPVARKSLGRGVRVLRFLVVIGAIAVVLRLFQGLGAVTNLNDQTPWGIWIAIDVASGVALAAGGFTTCALVYAFQRRVFAAVLRPALLTALLGYTFVVLALVVDVGRWWNIWRPMIHWNGNSVLFEVAMCVMFYLTVLYIEFIPLVAERFMGKVNLPGILAGLNKVAEKALLLADRTLRRVMWFPIITGIVLSCLHQSSLGALMLIAPFKVHPLWYTPLLPLLFLLSAIAVGLPVVIFESVLSAKALGREMEVDVLSGLARIVPYLLGLYLAVKMGDLLVRGAYVYLFAYSLEALCFWVELVFGLIIPFLLILLPPVRRSPGWLFWACTLLILGVLLNRINVFLIGYRSFYQETAYFPAVGEWAVTIGFAAALILVYRSAVSIFPVLKVEGTDKKSLAAGVFLLLSLLYSGQCLAVERPDCTQAPLVLPVMSLENATPLLVLDSLAKKESGALYQPVRFLHRRHAQLVQNCMFCHHRIPREEGDDYGIVSYQGFMGEGNSLPVACNKCHSQPWPAKQIDKPGLKGAYHQMCLGCHRESAQEHGEPTSDQIGGKLSGRFTRWAGLAPTDCKSCHAPAVPSDRDSVKLNVYAESEEVTASCFPCHKQLSHWFWQDSSSHAVGREKMDDLGKRGLDFDTSLSINDLHAYTREDCIRCHRKGSKESRLQIDVEGFKRSAHGAHSCRYCHRQIKDDSHLTIKAGSLVSCTNCHKQENRHGLTGGEDGRPKCYSCHTKHHILGSGEPLSSVNRKALGNTCAACHPSECGRGDYFSWFPSLKVVSHVKQDFSRAYDRMNCLGCHQGAGAHGEKMPIDEEDCRKCHNDLMRFMHPKADSAKQPEMFAVAWIYQALLVGLLWGGFRFYMAGRRNKRGEAGC